MKSAADIEETAAAWLVRRDGADWSDADEAAFERWKNETTAHRIAAIRLESVWNKAARLRASALPLETDAAPQTMVAELPREAATPRPRRWMWPAALAASLALVAVPVSQLFGGAEDYATAVGGFQQVPLDDGSRVDLNTDTALEVAYSEGERHVALARGEAFFKVAKDRSRPFVVEAGDTRVTAVGTAFTVRRRGSEVDVIVAEGRVRIEKLAAAGAVRPTFASAGEAARAPAAGMAVVRPLASAELDGALAWREGLLIFDGRPLGEAAAEFNRYNKTQLVVAPSATHVVVDGSFRATNVDGFVRLLGEGFGVKAAREEGAVITLK